MKISPYLIAALVVLVAACSTNPGGELPKRPIDKTDPLAVKRQELRDAKLGARQLYRTAHGSLTSSDFAAAVESYDKLSERFPFSDYATQGELERIYALYRNYDPDRALSAADKFTREHPRHAAIDYVQYIKGLTNYNRDTEGLNILPSDETKSDVGSLRRAYDDFATLLQKFPNSPYAGDAYQRMIFLRGRLADHELHVVDFYLRRGAYVAAAKRAEQIIGQYPGTVASHRALAMLEQCYEKAGLTVQAADAKRLLEAQLPLPDPKTRSAAAAAPARTVAETPPEKPGFLARVVETFSSVGSSEPAPAADKTAEATAPAPAAEATATTAAASVETIPAPAAAPEAKP